MAKVKFFTRSKKEVQPIRIRFSHTVKSKTTSLFATTKETVPAVFWNNKTGKVVKSAYFPDYEKLANTLEEINRSITDSFKYTPVNDVDTDWLNTCIDQYYFPEKYLSTDTLFGYIQKHFINEVDRRINRYGDSLSYRRKREYAEVFETLKKFKEEKNIKELDFHHMNEDFYLDFVQYLKEKGLKKNTIGKKIKVLKTFLNSAYKRNIHDFRYFMSWEPPSEDVDNIALSEKEIQKFYDFDFSNNKRLERVRDRFIIGCWSGLRVGDLSRVTNEDIQDGYINVKTQKVPKGVYIPIFNQMVKNIIDKYDGMPPTISDQKFNEYIKEAAQIAKLDEKADYKSPVKVEEITVYKHLPKHQLISSHTMRRTFCTNMYSRNVNIVTIMAVSGHTSERTFLNYIKVSSKEHAKRMKEEMEEYEKKAQ
jgi:integrase